MFISCISDSTVGKKQQRKVKSVLILKLQLTIITLQGPKISKYSPAPALRTLDVRHKVTHMIWHYWEWQKPKI